MDDIRRPKPTRPRVALPTHRRTDFSASVSGGTPRQRIPNGLERKELQKHRTVRVVVRFQVPGAVRSLAAKLRRYAPSRRKRPMVARFGWAGLAALMLLTVFIGVFDLRQAELQYQLSPEAEALIGPASASHADSLQLDTKTGIYEYNKGYQPGGDVAGQSSRPKFTATFNKLPEEGTTVTDPVNETSVTFKPDFGLEEPRQDQNRLVYPLKKGDATKVYSLKSSGFKEDIILNSFQGDELTFGYDLELAPGTEARMESDGSLAVYGVSASLLGNISTGSSKDEALLKKARENGEKSNLLFRFPAPFVVESGKKKSDAKAWFSLEGSELTVHAAKLKGASYPLSIDPSVYVETAAKLMRGNNETNIDFDVDGELIQKGSTTGARFDEWTSTMALNSGRWNGGTAVAGGKIYQVGGMETGSASMPVVAGQQISTQGSNSTNFTMNMPASRPAGDLYIAVIGHDGTTTVTPPAGGNWNEYSDVREHAAYWKIGENKSGGNEQATYQWSAGTSEQWAGVIIRVTGFDPTDPVSASDESSSSGSSATPTAPSVTPDVDFTLVLRAVGVDADPPGTGWGPSGHTEIAAARSSTSAANAGTFALARMNTPPAGGNPTGTAAFGGTLLDSYGASTIAIRPEPGATSVSADVNWAHFNTSSKAIESPNPGGGSCTGWCTNAEYSLPDERAGFSLVAYNGFLYAIGGVDSVGDKKNTVYVAKLGANGELARWHPTDTNQANWVYWYPSTTLSSVRSYTAAVAYNNRMYLLGGLTTTNATVSTVEYADINPTGALGTWSSTGMTSLPSARYGHTIHVYNDRIYLIGGNATFSGTPVATVHYAKLNTDGSMNSWVAANSFGTGRMSWGGSFTTIWGGYLYLMGGCSAVNGSGYCTAIENTVQLASINADGSLATWGSMTNLTNDRIGYDLVAWRNAIYRVGGCSAQNTGNGSCTTVIADADLGVINPDGDASTVDTSDPYAAGSQPGNLCSGFAHGSSSLKNCDIPPSGDNAGQGGGMSSGVAVNNGFIYIVGGCQVESDPGTCTGGMSGNTSYASIASDGSIVAPGSCGGTWYGTWCVDSTNRLNGTAGLGAMGIAVFNNAIYIIGGTSGGSTWSANVYSNSLNADGSLTAWSAAQSFSSLGMGGAGGGSSAARGYLYAFTRANPSSASTNPGNLYILGGCYGSSGIGCTPSTYFTDVFKCNISTAGTLNTCTTTSQLQIDSDDVNGGDQGIGLMAGTVYANYVYLVGGGCQQTGTNPTAPCGSAYASNRAHTIYSKIDSNNNIVAASGTEWVVSDATMSPVRRRGVAFGYNGYLYSLAGYSGTGLLNDLLFARINVSDGAIDPWETSQVTVDSRWDLRAVVSNGYVYAIGGCSAGGAPDCSGTTERSIQTFQLYNNESGSPVQYNSGPAFTTSRHEGGSAVVNGRLYLAGGCTTFACGAVSSTTQFAPINADGSLGSFTATENFPLSSARGWGQLETAGGSLYWIGGRTAAGSTVANVYRGVVNAGTGEVAWENTTSLPAGRSEYSSAVWNGRIYITGGTNGTSAQTTVYASSDVSAGGAISSWTTTGMTTFNIARVGHTAIAYAGNLYVLGGYTGSIYLSDVQYAKINTDGTIGSWSYSTSLPQPIRNADGFAANGYMYLFGGRSADTTCTSNTYVAPVSANTTIDSGNNPTGIGEWYQTNVRWNTGTSSDRYGVTAAYSEGRTYLMGGACTSIVAPANAVLYSTLQSQPQVAKYSRLIDTDTDVFPTKWLANGLDNSTGARWYMRYRSMTDTDNDCATMTTWGQETNFGQITLGQPENYIPLDGAGSSTSCSRFFYLSVTIDGTQAFGYPEDIARGPTLTDLSLFFTSDPSKRLRHGKTFTGGEQQPLDTPF